MPRLRALILRNLARSAQREKTGLTAGPIPICRAQSPDMPFAIPASPGAITAQWLTAALQAGKTVTSSSATAASLSRIGEDEGFTGGSLYLARLSYDHPEPGAPTTLVAKLSPCDPETRAIMRVANGREVDFYQTLAQDITLPVPRCYYAGCDRETGASILLLQDLSGHRSVPFIKGCGAADARRVIEALAEIHAKWWDNPALKALNGAAILDEFRFGKLWPRYPETLKTLLHDIDLPDSFLKLGHHIASNEADVFKGLLETAPITCLHRDVQIDNVMFAPANGGGGAILLDWQISGKGRGAYDVGYFLISSIEPAQRRNWERGLVAHYHAELLQRGVTGYSLAQCWTDYLQSVAGKLLLTVAATVLLDNSSAHKKAWRAADLKRLLAFCKDHRISEQTFAVRDQNCGGDQK